MSQALPHLSVKTDLADLFSRGEFGAVEHWAKVEAMHDNARTAKLRERLSARFPVAEFNAARRALDPKNILANDVVDALFPL